MDVKIRFTTDLFGCLVFPANSDIKALGLDNCFVVQAQQALWVFPFNILNRIIPEYQFSSPRRYFHPNGFEKLLTTKNYPCFYILYGQVVQQPFHYGCKNKMNYITNNVPCYNCKFTPLPNTIFKWNKHKCKFIKRIYCDTTFKTRRALCFDELNPDIQTEKANKAALTERGTKATFTKQLNKDKCSECIFITTCKEKKNRQDRKCSVTRKALNRQMRHLAAQRFGSFQSLVDLMRYTGKRQTFEVLIPINKELMIIKNNGSWYFDVKKVTDLSPVKKWSLAELEQKAKVYMFYECNLTEHNLWCYNAHTNSIWVLGSNGTIRIREYKFKSYLDVLKRFKHQGQEQVERVLACRRI